MSPKELLYVEDALGHAKQIKLSCGDFASQLGDAELKNFVSGLSEKQETAFDRFYALL